jgi:hypothetical protein
MPLSGAQLHPWQVHGLSVSLSNRAAYATWYDDVAEYLADRAAKEAADPHAAQRAPPPTLYALRLSGATTRLAPADLPREDTCRLTHFGPGAGAPIYAYTRLTPYYFTVAQRVRGGRSALFEKPFWALRAEPKPPRVQIRRDAAPADRRMARAASAAATAAAAAARATAAQTRAAAIYRDTNCNLCDAPNGDAVHLCTACPRTAARREQALGGGRLAALLLAVTEALAAAHHRLGVPGTLADAINGLDPTSPEGVFLVTRIVTCSPWRVADTTPSWTVAPRLGTLLDRTVRRSAVAPLSDAWVLATHTIVTTVCLRWRELLAPPARAALETAGHRFPA